MLDILERPRRGSSGEDIYRAKAKKASNDLLGRLRRFHAEVMQTVQIETIDPVEPEEAVVKTLPPVPNEQIALASEIAFPPFAFSYIETIQRAVLREFPKMTMADLRSPRREAPVVRARQIAMYVAKKVTAKSLPEIGRRFGGRDHTTVLHAVRKIDGKLASDPELAALVQRIKDSLPEFPV